MPEELRNDGAKVLAKHLKNCLNVDAVVVMHRPEENGDEVVAILQDQNWVLKETQVVAGKRIRIMEYKGTDERPCT